MEYKEWVDQLLSQKLEKLKCYKGREGEVEGALNSASVVAARRTWYRRRQNEAVRSSVPLRFSDRHFVDLELPMSIG